MRTVARSALAMLSMLAVGACSIEPRTDLASASDADATPVASSRRQIVQPEGIARLPVFSTAVRSDNLLFLSGQIGTRPGIDPPQLVAGGVEAETRRTMENITAVLTSEGLTLRDLVKCTVFLADIADYAAMNSIYLEYFQSSPPARSAMAGSGLALGARVEIECIAAYPEGR